MNIAAESERMFMASRAKSMIAFQEEFNVLLCHLWEEYALYM